MARPERKRRVGRPSKMEEIESDDPDEKGFVSKRLCDQAMKLCMLGLIDERVAEIMGIDTPKFYRWQKDYPEFSKAVQAGKEGADAEVVHGLYHRAIGYSHPEEKVFTYEGAIITHETTKHYPPSEAAGIFWLKNRHRDKWRDVKSSELSGPDGRAIEIQQNHVIQGRQLEHEERTRLRAFLEREVTDVAEIDENDATDEEIDDDEDGTDG